MKVFKFGGASVKDAAAVKNVAHILQENENQRLVIVISAMGKTTNALENILNLYWQNQDFSEALHQLKKYHTAILDGLFDDRKAAIWQEMDMIFDEIKQKLHESISTDYDLVYDRIISYGEIISTKIVSAYLSISGYWHIWIDARNLIFTDNLHREARVNFEKTNNAIQQNILPVLYDKVVLTQGFIAMGEDGATTTLGREGSDYTAAILAAALDAEELVIWKDVPGILNADPHKFQDTVKFDFLSYKDAVEMTYFGASVLHPKTIKPVENKHIPLHVKSFLYPRQEGTYILPEVKSQTKTPVLILKENQALISISTRNLSFIAEENIMCIFEEVVRYGIKVNVMQNSAVSFIICIDDSGQKVHDFTEALSADFILSKTTDLQLLTLKNASEENILPLLHDKNILLEMRTPKTSQFVIERSF